MNKPIDHEKVQRVLAEKTYEDGDCLVWTGRTSYSRGHPKYGDLTMRRVVWELRNGPLKAGELVTTTCGRVDCLEHLAITDNSGRSKKANADIRVRAIKRIKATQAARARTTKLSLEKARAIRESTDCNHTEAAKWGVTHSMVSKIRRGLAWAESPAASPWAGLGAR